MSNYKYKYFKAYELVPKTVYEELGEDAFEWIDPKLMTALEYIRERLGTVTINTWKQGGALQYRGLRTKESKHYSTKSQHCVGKAADFDVKGMTAQEVREWLIDNREEPALAPITFIEMAVHWVHIDIRPAVSNTLTCWYPDGRVIKQQRNN